jgi:hypothetical protein
MITINMIAKPNQYTAGNFVIKSMHDRYEKLLAVLFFGSTLVSVIKIDFINPPIWFLCTLLYLFKVDPSKNALTKVMMALNLLMLLLGYILLFYQVFQDSANDGIPSNNIYGISTF